MKEVDQIRKRDKNKLPTINSKVVSLPQKTAMKEVRFKGDDFTGNILLKAVKFLARGCTTELEVKLSQGVTSTKESNKQK